MHMPKLEAMHAYIHSLSYFVTITYTNVYTRVHTCTVNTYTQAHMHTPNDTHICTYSHEYTSTYTYIHIHTHTTHTCQIDNTDHHSTKDKPQLRALFTKTTPSPVLGCT